MRERFVTTASVASLGGGPSRKLMIGIGAGVLMLIVVIAVVAGGSDDAKPTTTAKLDPGAKQRTQNTAREPSEVPVDAAVEIDAAEASAEPTGPAGDPVARTGNRNGSGGAAATEPSEPSEPREPTATPPPANPTTTTSPKPPVTRVATVTRPPTTREPVATRVKPRAAVGDPAKARASYNLGTKRLIAGDTAAAIRAYREAVVQSPRLAAAHRQLGLAYEKQGDKANAIKSLRAYVQLAPTAKDAQLIKKRIQQLQAR